MTKIVFTTQIDHYKTSCWPTDLSIAPRIGEKVLVTKVFIDYFRSKKLPTRLEVVDVTHTDDGIVCELHYNKLDKQIADQNGANTL
jgi:hypothetical protein